MRLLIMLLVINASCLYSCRDKGLDQKIQNTNSGIIEIISETPGVKTLTGNEDMFNNKSKVWFRDSFAIEEIISFQSHYKNDSLVYAKRIVQCYRFNDLKNRKIYLFSNFSDTARWFKKYNFDDSITVEAGWGFNFKRSNEYSQSPQTLQDTIIGNNTYRRLALVFKEKQSFTYKICYFDCSRNNYPFNFDTTMSRKIGCPLTIMSYTDSTFKKIFVTDKLHIAADRLTPEENKVFDAWIAYARQNPAHK